MFSAHNGTSLDKQIQTHSEYAQSQAVRAVDLAYTRALRREELRYRGFSILRNGQFATISDRRRSPDQPPALVMVFSGQGAQWAGMGRELLQTNAGFRKDIAEMDEILRGAQYAPTWTIQGE